MFSTREGQQYAYNQYTFLLVREKCDGKGGIAGESQTKVFMRMHAVSFITCGICTAWLNGSLHTSNPLEAVGEPSLCSLRGSGASPA